MVGFINDAYPIPQSPPPDVAAGKESADHQDFTAWRCSDRLLRGWITGTLSEEVLGLVVGLDSSIEVWQTLEESFAKESQEREFYLPQQLQMHRKSTYSLADYVRTFKGYCDDLSIIGKPVGDRQKVFSLLQGLGLGYDSFVTSMLKPPTPSYKENVPLLQGHETMQNMHHTDGFGSPNPTMNFLSHKQPGGKRSNSQKGKHVDFTSTGHGFPPAGHPSYSQNRGQGILGEKSQNKMEDKHSSNPTIAKPNNGTLCQIYNKPNHLAMRCWHRFNQTSQPADATQALATLNLADTQDGSCFPDTGAAAHMIPDLGKLQSLTPYQGLENILVGNGTVLDITHVGSTCVKHGDNDIKLNNVLVIPEIKKNLLSVSQLTSEYPYLFEFSSSGFVVKHRHT